MKPQTVHVGDRAPSVLLVEDERIIAKDLQLMLADIGYEAFAIAASSDEALRHASQRCPDVVLMDIHIDGDLDGIEAAKLLIEQFDVPVIYLTAHADEHTLGRAARTQPYGYLLKPVRPEEVRSAIDIAFYKHRMDRTLRERERWFQTTLSSIGDAVVTVDLAGRVTFVNSAAEKLLGVPEEAALGRSASELLTVEVDGELQTPLDDTLATGLNREILEGVLRSENGSSRVISDSVAPVRDGNELLGAVMVFRDVTEQREMQRQLEISDRLASLGTMAAGVAHEINNPLAIVVANAWFARESLDDVIAQLRSPSVDPTEVADRLQMLADAESEVIDASERIGRIVRDLLSFAKPAPSTIEGADLRRAIEWAIRTTRHEVERHAELAVRIEPNIPPTSLDDTRLGQVLVNLLINATQSLSEGRITHRIELRARLDGEFVVIEVSDTGVGMNANELAQACDPFFTTKDPGAGTGLGLSICQGILRSAGGTLELRSTPGEGTVATVRLPRASGDNDDCERSSAPTIRMPAASARVLVVDDEELMCRSIQRVLDEHEVSYETKARRALERLDDGESFDIVFVDVAMSPMSGVEFYDEIVAHHPAVAGRIVFVTGGAVSPRVASFLEVVGNRVLGKPFSMDEIRELVARSLDD